MVKPKPDRASAVDRFSSITSARPEDAPGIRTVSTRDREAIRRWAAQHAAEPATGEASASGPAVKNVTDDGVGIRFNFPGFAPFRPISWDEWFTHFDRYELTFVYEEADPVQVAQRAHELWTARAEGDGGDQDDWFQAERELRARRSGGGSPNIRYRFVNRRQVG